MANNFTSYLNKNVGTSAATVVTIAASTQTTIIGLSFANTTTSPITTTVYLARASVNYYLVYQATIPVGGSLEVIQGNRVVLIASDALYILNSAASSGDAVVSALTAV